MSQQQKQVNVAKVIRHDGPIALPKQMTLPQAIEVLERQSMYEAEKVKMVEQIPVFPWDGAIALQKALQEQFGYAMQEKDEGFLWFEGEPPSKQKIEIGPGVYADVPWGRFSLPGIKGTVETGTSKDSKGRVTFAILATVTHADEDAITRLFARTREIALAESIYRGKAISIRFRTENGNMLPLPEIHFLEPYTGPVIFSEALENTIERNVFTPIRFRKELARMGESFKRGVLLAGPYGTGKTLLSGKTAMVATHHGCTFLYVPDVHELPDAYRFAAAFLTPCVIQVEDIDRAATSDRTEAVNEILNTVDGIDTKDAEIMHIMTTNHPEQINKAMNRKGRTDVVIPITLPDAEAGCRLAAYYAGKSLLNSEDMLQVAGESLNGLNPADIRESVRRARLEAMRRTAGVDDSLIPQDIATAAQEVRAENKLMAGEQVAKEHPMQLVGRGLGDRLADGLLATLGADNTNGRH